jgi:transcription antitermination factor NusG
MTPDALSQSVAWFALHVRSRHENLTATILQRKGYETFLPLYTLRRMWSDRIKELQQPLFAGYVFCRLDLNNRVVPIITTPGVLGIIGSGKNPLPVDDHEIAALQTIVRSGLPIEPCPYLQVGSVVRIEHGPLSGTEGTLIEIKNRHRMIVSISLLRRSVSVQVDEAWITRVSPSSCRLDTARGQSD